MPQRSWFQFRSRFEGKSSVPASIAVEAQEIVLKAAGQAAGRTITAQMNHAAEALGYRRGYWRIHEAWYGRAGSWSAKALEELRERYRSWEEKQLRRADAADLKHAAVLSAIAETEPGDKNAESRRACVERIRAHAKRLVSQD